MRVLLLVALCVCTSGSTQPISDSTLVSSVDSESHAPSRPTEHRLQRRGKKAKEKAFRQARLDAAQAIRAASNREANQVKSWNIQEKKEESDLDKKEQKRLKTVADNLAAARSASSGASSSAAAPVEEDETAEEMSERISSDAAAKKAAIDKEEKRKKNLQDRKSAQSAAAEAAEMKQREELAQEADRQEVIRNQAIVEASDQNISPFGSDVDELIRRHNASLLRSQACLAAYAAKRLGNAPKMTVAEWNAERREIQKNRAEVKLLADFIQEAVEIYRGSAQTRKNALDKLRSVGSKTSAH